MNYIDLFGTGKSGPHCEPEPDNDGLACELGSVSGTCLGGLCGAEELCDGVVCEDDDNCTDDACAWNGQCTFTPVTCDDDDLCTENRCDPATGSCDFSAPAEDSNWCFVGDSPALDIGGCEAGVCVAPCDPDAEEETPCPVDFPLGALRCCPGNESCVVSCAQDL